MFPIRTGSAISVTYCQTSTQAAISRDVSPLQALNDNDGLPEIPMMFIHGAKGGYIPPDASQKPYAAKRGMKSRRAVGVRSAT